MVSFASFNDPLDDPLGKVSPADPAMYCSRVVGLEGTIKSVKLLTHDMIDVVIQCDDPGNKLSGFAGQYAVLQPSYLEHPRAYSFARAPECEAPGEHTFLIRRIEGGRFSSWLTEDRVGETLKISGPLGKFQLDSSTKPMLCIGGGSGLSAIFAILQHACEKQVERDAYFFYGARTQKDLCMVDEIQVLADEWHPDYKLEFVPVLSMEDEDSGWNGARGMVTDYANQTYIHTGKIPVADCVAYFCGPPPMIDAGIAVLEKEGILSENIRYDKFEDASSPAPVIDNTKCVLCDECLMVKPMECIIEIAGLKKTGDDGHYSFAPLKPAETSGLYYNSLFIDENECIRCYACVDACPADAINPNYKEKPKIALRDFIE